MISVSPQWYAKKWVVISLHVLCWILILIFPYLIKISVEHDSNAHPDKNAGNFYMAFAVQNLMRALLFYANAYFFIPKLAYARRFGQYLIALLAMFCLLTAWNWFIYWLFIPGLHFRIWSYVLFELPIFVFFVVGSTAFRVVADRIREQQRVKEKETENLKTELSFLRSQVSPHFMFNVLNNMVALARKKSDLLEPSLIKLSSLLRYMLYETDEDKVLLEKEIEYLKSFIELQAQRFGKNVEINITFEPVPDGFVIEPMLLIPFVENAFKHGTGLVPQARIDIHLKLENNQLNLCVRNRYNETTEWEKDKTSGIGLTNVKRRLNLLYPNIHSLQITKEDGWFSVLLKLNLH
ncbi:MAG TPA: histidine kinase [Puia sp.]|jgi:two-component system LytT family sensor kinase|nr:histidine kinase [Puia sp.]